MHQVHEGFVEAWPGREGWEGRGRGKGGAERYTEWDKNSETRIWIHKRRRRRTRTRTRTRTESTEEAVRGEHRGGCVLFIVRRNLFFKFIRSPGFAGSVS